MHWIVRLVMSVVCIAVILSGEVGVAQTPPGRPPIESAMRELEIRYEWLRADGRLTGPAEIGWTSMSCAGTCSAVPAYPADGYFDACVGDVDSMYTLVLEVATEAHELSPYFLAEASQNIEGISVSDTPTSLATLELDAASLLSTITGMSHAAAATKVVDVLNLVKRMKAVYVGGLGFQDVECMSGISDVHSGCICTGAWSSAADDAEGAALDNIISSTECGSPGVEEAHKVHLDCADSECGGDDKWSVTISVGLTHGDIHVPLTSHAGVTGTCVVFLAVETCGDINGVQSAGKTLSPPPPVATTYACGGLAADQIWGRFDGGTLPFTTKDACDPFFPDVTYGCGDYVVSCPESPDGTAGGSWGVTAQAAIATLSFRPPEGTHCTAGTLAAKPQDNTDAEPGNSEPSSPGCGGGKGGKKMAGQSGGPAPGMDGPGPSGDGSSGEYAGTYQPVLGDVWRVPGGWMNRSGQFMPETNNPVGPHPVDFAWGFKYESIQELAVPVSGYTFTLTREYASRPRSGGLAGYGLVGADWTMSAFQFLVEGSGSTLVHAGSPRQSTVYESDGGSPATWRPAGAQTQFIQEATHTSDWDQDGVTSTSITEWRMTQPGQWETDFYRSVTSTDVDPALHGLVREWRDYHGNKRSYEYALYDDGSSGKSARLRAIYLNGAPGSSDWDAKLAFSWIVDGEDAARNGRLRSITVFRHDSGGNIVTTEQVDYTYKADSDGNDDDTGTAGDLIEVRHRVLVDGVVEDGEETGSAPYRALITQYRYHDGGTPGSESTERLTTSGAVHQLKMVINPQQIEFYAQQSNSARSTAWDSNQALVSAADQLRTMADGDSAPDWPSGSSAPMVVDLSAKVVGYESSGSHRVSTQYLQSACGCGGGATQGLKESYTYLSDTGDVYRTTAIDEYRFLGGSPEYETTPYRTSYADLKLLKTGGSYYLRYSALHETGGRTWAEAYVYDDAGATPTYTMAKYAAPSAVSGYTAASGTTAASATIESSTGLVYAFAYNGEKRLTEVRIGNGDQGDVGDFNLLAKITYPSSSSGSERTWLPKRLDLFTTDTTSVPTDQSLVMTSWFTYGFHSGDSLAWIRTFVEAETTSENGPSSTGVTDPESSSTACYDSYSLIDQYGLTRWVRAEDGALTYFDYDERSGALTKVVRNADPAGTGSPNPALSGGDYASVSISGWGRFSSGVDESLTTTYQHDLLGRTTEVTSPGNVNSYTRRELRPAFERDKMLYAATVSLPHQLVPASGSVTAVYDGPAAYSLSDAGGSQIESREFELDPSADYAPLDGTYELLLTTGELARSTVQQHLSGLTESTKMWQRFDATPANDAIDTITYEYDKLGRVDTVTGPTGTMTESVYDVQDRVIETKVGTSSGNMETVAEYFYDHTMSGSDPVQGTGDGNLSFVRAYAGPTKTNPRDSVTVFDYRDRAVAVLPPAPPYQATEFDNLDRPVARAIFDNITDLDSATGVHSRMNTSTDGNRGLYMQSSYSQRSLSYRATVALDPAADVTSASNLIGTDRWYDAVGRTITVRSPNGPVAKLSLDAHGRAIMSYAADRAGSSYAAATSVTSDIVVEQTATHYNSAGLPDLVMSTKRLHDASPSATGALTTGGTTPTGITSFAGSYYDEANRLTHTVNFGTNNSTANIYANDTSTPPSPPSSTPEYTGGPDTDLRLISSVTYNTRGLIAASVDPMGRVTAYMYDLLGRKYATIENATYTDGLLDVGIAWDASLDGGRWKVTGGLDSAHPDQNRVTTTVFDESGNVVRQVAHLPGSGSATESVQVTEYVYGVSTSGTLPSGLASNDLLGKVHYPDESTGSPNTSADHTASYVYNTQGELTAVKDQNSTKHEYARDALGRSIRDDVTLFGSNIDTTIQSIHATFDGIGRLSEVNSYDETGTSSSTHIKNGVTFTYNGLWQVEHAYQNVSAEATYSGGSPTGTTVDVKYTYAQSPIASGNYSRVTKLAYPSTDEERYGYGTSSSLNDRISRVEKLTFGLNYGTGFANVSLAQYAWIGLDTPAVVDYTGAYVQLDRTAARNGTRRYGGINTGTVGAYPGFDRYGRVINQTWIDDDATTQTIGGMQYPTRPQIVAEGYTYDRNSNRLSRTDWRVGASQAGRDFEFQYDGLDRLVQSRRGIANTDGTITTPGLKSQAWALDMLGNWSTLTTETNGTGGFDSGDNVEDRVHNAANQITTRTPTSGGTGLDLTYDFAGNLRTIDQSTTDTRTITHDAWNRLIRYSDRIDMGGGSYLTSLAWPYSYNGLGWRIYNNGFQSTSMYYSASWQLLEEDRVQQELETISGSYVTEQFWGIRYIDDPVARWVKPAADDGQLYFQLTDVQFSTVAVMDTNNYLLHERVVYDPYGKARHHWAFDFDGDGDYDAADTAAFTALGGTVSIGTTGYNADMDVDRDGTDDISVDMSYAPPTYQAALPDGAISDSNGPDNVVGYDGYILDRQSMLYCVRFRWYDPTLIHRWLQRDPLGSLGGPNQYLPVSARPMILTDEFGLFGGEAEPPYESDPSNPSRLVHYAPDTAAGSDGKQSTCDKCSAGKRRYYIDNDHVVTGIHPWLTMSSDRDADKAALKAFMTASDVATLLLPSPSGRLLTPGYEAIEEMLIEHGLAKGLAREIAKAWAEDKAKSLAALDSEDLADAYGWMIGASAGLGMYTRLGVQTCKCSIIFGCKWKESGTRWVRCLGEGSDGSDAPVIGRITEFTAEEWAKKLDECAQRSFTDLDHDEKRIRDAQNQRRRKQP